ncbi:MAG TPA: LytTR family DNA-binding domain-containing protein [Emticicia sp.]
MKINCLIVDDEPIARELLRTYTERVPELILLNSCQNANEAYESLYKSQIDLIFLDIKMPVITGVEFLRSLRKPPLIVLTTAYSEYAVEGFELNCVDYLLKPITFERFYQATQKVLERMSVANQLIEEPDYLFIKQDNKLVKVNYVDIQYIRAERDYCMVYLTDKKLLASMHLRIFENRLPKQQFVRVHRSFIINISKLKAIQGNMIDMGQEEIPIGLSYRENLFNKLRI